MSGAPLASAPFLAAAVLLGGAGVAKAAAPHDTATALRAARLPFGQGAVRAGAVVELAVAVAALAHPGPLTGALVSAAYAVFAGFVAVALRRGWAIASCGCFGRPDTPPTGAHVALNLAATAAAAWWAATAPASLGSLFAGQPWDGVPLGLVSAAVALLAYLVFTNPLDAARRTTTASRAGS